VDHHPHVSFCVLRSDATLDKQGAEDCLSAAFAEREPMSTAMGISVSEFRQFARFIIDSSSHGGLSVIAKEKVTNRVVGVFISEDLESGEVPLPEYISNKFDPILSLLSSLYIPYKKNESRGPGKTVHQLMLAVDSSNTGLMPYLVSYGEEVAKKKGFEGAVAEVTGPISYHVVKSKLGYEDYVGENRIAYSDFIYEGVRVFSKVTEAKHCRLVTKSFAP
jgi:hypothetical protein